MNFGVIFIVFLIYIISLFFKKTRAYSHLFKLLLWSLFFVTLFISDIDKFVEIILSKNITNVTATQAIALFGLLWAIVEIVDIFAEQLRKAHKMTKRIS